MLDGGMGLTLSVEDQHPRGDKHVDAGDNSAKQGKSAAH